jgi:hypothetical protein
MKLRTADGIDVYWTHVVGERWKSGHMEGSQETIERYTRTETQRWLEDRISSDAPRLAILPEGPLPEICWTAMLRSQWALSGEFGSFLEFRWFDVSDATNVARSLAMALTLVRCTEVARDDSF